MSIQIENLTVKNFRCLQEIDIALGRLNVLIGPNGSGKTSLLEIFELLANGANQKLARCISDKGGISELLTQNGQDSKQLKISLAAKVEWHDDPLIYELILSHSGLGYSIHSESLSPWHKSGHKKPFVWIDNRPGHPRYYDIKENKLVAPDWEGYDEQEPLLGQVPKIHDNHERFRKLLSSTSFLSYVDVGEKSVIRNPQNLEPNILLPGPNGENLISALYNLRTSQWDIYQRILEGIQSAFSGFDDLDFPLVAAGKATMIWKENGRNFYPHQMSEGTLRYLWLTTLLLSPALPPITLIDEPEVSLHPELLMLLAGLIQEASQKSLLIVSTHSDRLIRWLNPEDIVVVNQEKGISTLVRANDPSFKIETWLKDYSLDELWLMGELGGRP